MSIDSKIIGVDFDGTCVTHAYPDVGKDIGAVPVLQALVRGGNRIVLWTMRSGETLQDAVKWFRDNIELWGINQNPEQMSWTTSPKAHCDIYIDDRAIGCPLRNDPWGAPYVDWLAVRKYLYRLEVRLDSHIE